MGKRYGRYIYIMYLLTKCLYITNAILQIMALNGIFGKYMYMYIGKESGYTNYMYYMIVSCKLKHCYLKQGKVLKKPHV